MVSDRQRLEALRQGIAAAPPEGNVAIAVRDLRWLLEQVELAQTVTQYEAEEPHDE